MDAIVVLLPDAGERYITTVLLAEEGDATPGAQVTDRGLARFRERLNSNLRWQKPLK